MTMLQNSGTLEGKLFIVTGASSGVGYATVRRLTQVEGATVVAVARRRMFRLEALSKQVPNGRLIVMAADMTARDVAHGVIAQICDQFGPVDGYVHGINRVLRSSPMAITSQDFDLTMQVNVKSALFGIQALVPALRGQSPRAIVVYNPTPLETDHFDPAAALSIASAQTLSSLLSAWNRHLADGNITIEEVSPAPVGLETPEPMIAHDLLLVNALRDGLSPSRIDRANRGQGSSVTQSEPRAVVRTERGGLRLTWFQ